MKIVLIHPIFYPEFRGGSDTVVSSIASGLVSAGHQVSVICLGREKKEEVINNIKVNRIKHFNIFSFLEINFQPVWKRLIWHVLDVFNDVQAYRVYKIIKSESPDLILFHNLKGLGYVLPRLAKILRIKHSLTIHDMQYLHPSGRLLDGQKLSWIEIIYKNVCRLLVGSPDKVIFPSSYMAEIYKRNGFFKTSNIVILGNPLPEKVLIGEVKKSSRNILNKINFVFVGQVEEYKGILSLIKALSGLPGEWSLLVAGEGKALEDAKKLALDLPQVKFFDFLSQIELEQKIWSEADLLINPSQVPESFGMVVVEAYARGVPVLASNIGALSEIVKEAKTGWLFKSGDWYDLRHRLEFILANPEKLKELKNNCLSEAKNYSLPNYINKLLNSA